MGVKKVFMTRRIYICGDEDVSKRATLERICSMLSDSDMIAVIILNDNIDLTINRVRVFERMFKAVWRENVVALY